MNSEGKEEKVKNKKKKKLKEREKPHEYIIFAEKERELHTEKKQSDRNRYTKRWEEAYV